jgi:nitrogen fixation/metabolism regulation signal transduction histidine kinase
MRIILIAGMVVALATWGAAAAQRTSDRDVLAMAQGVSAVSHDPKAIANYLQQEAQRRQLAEAFIVDSHGQTLVSTVRKDAPVFAAPAGDILRRARAGGVVTYHDAQANGFAVTRLSFLNDAYLVVAIS